LLERSETGQVQYVMEDLLQQATTGQTELRALLGDLRSERLRDQEVTLKEGLGALAANLKDRAGSSGANLDIRSSSCVRGGLRRSRIRHGDAAGDRRSAYDPHVPHYLVTECRGPNWDPAHPRRAQDGFEQHAAFMDSLVEQGTVLLGGPLGDDVNAGDALVVISADDEAGVRAILAPDPWLGTVLAIKSIQRWSLWLQPPRR
jgi:uncharacterized protein YciI